MSLWRRFVRWWRRPFFPGLSDLVDPFFEPPPSPPAGSPKGIDPADHPPPGSLIEFENGQLAIFLGVQSIPHRVLATYGEHRLYVPHPPDDMPHTRRPFVVSAWGTPDRIPPSMRFVFVFDDRPEGILYIPTYGMDPTDFWYGSRVVSVPVDPVDADPARPEGPADPGEES